MFQLSDQPKMLDSFENTLFHVSEAFSLGQPSNDFCKCQRHVGNLPLRLSFMSQLNVSACAHGKSVGKTSGQGQEAGIPGRYNEPSCAPIMGQNTDIPSRCGPLIAPTSKREPIKLSEASLQAMHYSI
jgi:hypothetical protein